MSSSWGKRIRISLFGESRGAAVGVVLDGLPAGEALDLKQLQHFMSRRAPDGDELSSSRREADEPKILSGLKSGFTTGAPLAILIENKDAVQPEGEDRTRVPRPGHADYPAQVKYHGYQDAGGGGHFSGRLTAPLCAAGGICLQLLSRRGITIGAHIASIASVQDERFNAVHLELQTLQKLQSLRMPVLSAEAGDQMRRAILCEASDGDSLGGVIECAALGLPIGLGGAWFGGLESRIASLVYAIPAVKGLEFGDGFAAANMRGSEHNDAYVLRDGALGMETNHAGGVLGGMSTGLPLIFRTAFKPTPSIAKPQRTVDLQSGEETTLCVTGRNDPCVVLRAVPAVEAATAIALLDALLEG